MPLRSHEVWEARDGEWLLGLQESHSGTLLATTRGLRLARNPRVLLYELAERCTGVTLCDHASKPRRRRIYYVTRDGRLMLQYARIDAPPAEILVSGLHNPWLAISNEQVKQLIAVYSGTPYTPAMHFNIIVCDANGIKFSWPPQPAPGVEPAPWSPSDVRCTVVDKPPFVVLITNDYNDDSAHTSRTVFVAGPYGYRRLPSDIAVYFMRDSCHIEHWVDTEELVPALFAVVQPLPQDGYVAAIWYDDAEGAGYLAGHTKLYRLQSSRAAAAARKRRMPRHAAVWPIKNQAR